MSKCYLCLRVGQTAGEVGEHVDQAVADVQKVVRLPVIPHSRREQRIENRLPRGVRLRADDVGDRTSELAQRLENALTVGKVARVARGEDEDLATMPCGG